MTEEINKDCPCKRKKCERYGNCVLCREHHYGSKRKPFPACERLQDEDGKSRKRNR